MAGRRRLLSTDSVTLEEVITVYEKLKKGRERNQSRIFRSFISSNVEEEADDAVDELSNEDASTVLLSSEGGDPETGCATPEENGLPSASPFPSNQRTNGNNSGNKSPAGTIHGFPMDFHKYQDYYRDSKYSYFSVKTDLLHSNKMEGLSPDYEELFHQRYFWLNIADPNEDDLRFLRDTFKVNEMVLAEIAEGNTEEKVETFRHHTFISFRLLGDLSRSSYNGEISGFSSLDDMDFNMILFKDFIITTHRNPWGSIPDILSFLYLICRNGKMELEPESILFAVLIELSQDAKYLLNLIEPEINNIRIGSKSLAEMSTVMRRNLDMEFQIYKINAFIKPKINVLRQFLASPIHSKNLSEKMKKHFVDACNDFSELVESLNSFNHIVERSQDTILALANVEHARLANGLAIAMNRIGEIALVFLPVQALAGFFGMNVKVPFQGYDSTVYFWSIVFLSALIAICVYIRSRSVSNKSEVTPLPVKLRGDLMFEAGLLGDNPEKGPKLRQRRSSKFLKLRTLYSRISFRNDDMKNN